MDRVRISDVAELAGVSASTVSLVLSDAKSRISEKTRQRVREAASSVGYTPNTVARGLRTQRTRTVGMISNEIATTPYAGRMLAGAQDVAREAGNLMLLVDTGDDRAVEQEAISALTAHQVDAMIYACMWHRIVPVPAGLPRDTVFLDCRPDADGFRSVVPDDRAGGAAATRELIRAGHTRIAFVDTTDPLPIASGLRHEGYVSELTAHGIEVDPALHVREETSTRGGSLATAHLLGLPEGQRPTAIFYFNDRMAVGAYSVAHRLGLELPRDLSIVGYDDQQLLAAEQDPPLTTIALPHYEMGRWAMEVALGVRAVEEKGATHLMECPVIRRGTVGPPPAHVGKPNRRRAS